MLRIVGARGNNLKNVDGRDSGRPVHLRHRRLGLGQVDAGQRHALRTRSRTHALRQPRRAGAARRDRGPRALRQGDRHRPEPDRPHAALATRPPTPACSRRSASCSPQVPEARERGYGAGPLQLQREGRPLRGLPGRRRDQGRDALPARRLRALRRLPRPALQPRDARDPLQGQEHPRSARHDGRGGARVLRAPCRRSRASCRRCSTSAWATSRSARARPRCRAARRSA